MIGLTAVGLSAILTASEAAFYIIKFFGVFYLIYLGVKILRSPVSEKNQLQSAEQKKPRLSELARQEFLVAIGNPKAILIFTAFFPQFMSPEQPALFQFAVMGGIFLLLETIAISIYAISGRQLGSIIQSASGQRLFNRLSGGILVSSAALLAMTKRTA
jgi:threonine/homoserine/homoserine lactone efflux protein